MVAPTSELEPLAIASAAWVAAIASAGSSTTVPALVDGTVCAAPDAERCRALSVPAFVSFSPATMTPAII
jgi:hypothetical protein